MIGTMKLDRCEQHGLEPHEPYASSAMGLETQIMPFIKK